MKFEEKLRARILYSHVRKEEAGLSLLEYLTRSFSRFDADGWEKQLLGGAVKVNGNTTVLPDTPLKQHDEVAFYPGEMPEPEAELSCRIVYEDADLLVADKPANLCVHPTGPFYRHTLWNLLAQKYGEVHFVSRLDKETSGLLVAARNAPMAALLEQVKYHKEYLALVHGGFPGKMRANGWLVPDPDSLTGRRWKFVAECPAGKGLSADTELESVCSVPPDMTLIRAILHTGRKHQIRATLFSLGFPVVGDKLYGMDERLFFKVKDQSFTEADRRLLRTERQCLHASVLEFIHPKTGVRIRCDSPCPEIFSCC